MPTENDKRPQYRVGFIRQLSGRSWKSSPDKAWHTVTRAHWFDEEVKFVGSRLIDGVKHDIFRVPGGAFEAQESMPARPTSSARRRAR